jgi:NADH-quinone oxidoreductase subunit A
MSPRKILPQRRHPSWRRVAFGPCGFPPHLLSKRHALACFAVAKGLSLDRCRMVLDPMSNCLCCRMPLPSDGWKLPIWRRRLWDAQMNELLNSYLPIIIFIGVALVIGLALTFAPFVVAFKAPDPEKLSAYECGFNAFDDARMKFDVRFYLVSILFIIFDLEVAFLFPWAVSFNGIGMFGFWSMMVFLAVLTIGFIYEWKKGALEWD